MAEFYTVPLDDTAGAEITGGRVGHFILECTDGYYLGGSGVSNADLLMPGGVVNPFSIYVTSPDEVFAITAVDPSGTMRVFHNR